MIVTNDRVNHRSIDSRTKLNNTLTNIYLFLFHSYSILIRTHKSFTKVGFTGSIEQQDMFQTAIGRRIRSNDKNTPSKN